MKTIACIIARTNSTRLPKKVLKKINGKMMIEHIIERVKKAKNVDEIYICTSKHKDDQILNGISQENGVKFYAGSEDSVIDRMLDVAEIENADNVIRITGDNIFTDSAYLDIMIQEHNQNGVDYTRTEYLPVGLTAEIIKVSSLKQCYKLMNPDESQYLLIYMFNPKFFNCLVLLPAHNHRHPNWSLTVDNDNDWQRTIALFELSSGFLTYDKIIEISDTNIPYLFYGVSNIVKFPANLTLYFESFRKEMELRIESSKKIEIPYERYIEVINEQQ